MNKVTVLVKITNGIKIEFSESEFDSLLKDSENFWPTIIKKIHADLGEAIKANKTPEYIYALDGCGLFREKMNELFRNKSNTNE